MSALQPTAAGEQPGAPAADDGVLVTVLDWRTLLGWPDAEHGGRVCVVPLAFALERSYSSDAHAAQYTSAIGRRLNLRAVDHGAKPILRSAWFDLDCPSVHGTGQPAPRRWRATVLRRFERAVQVHPGLFLYMTRGGARIVGRLSPPMVIESRDDALVWSQKYAIASAYLGRRFGLKCDRACVEWNRLFRLPRATREGEREPEAWPTYGDPTRVGVLQIDEGHADVAAARRAYPRLFGKPRRRMVTSSPSPMVAASGDGLFFHLLRARGALLCEHGSAAFVIACPNAQQHTCGRDGDGSTLLYLPTIGQELGLIFCLHAHCAGLRARDWLRLFSESEIDTARRAAGIVRVA